MTHPLFTTYGGAVLDLTPTRIIRSVGNSRVIEPPQMVARLLTGRDAHNARCRVRTSVSATERLKTYTADRTRSLADAFNRY